MIKLLVSCDDYACYYDGTYYLKSFGNILVQRYLSVFSTVRLAVRTKQILTESDLGDFTIPVIDERIEIYPIPFFQGPKQYAEQYIKVKSSLHNVTLGCQVAIFRLPSSVAFAVLDVVLKKKIPYAIEVVANPVELKQNAGNYMYKLFVSRWDKYLKKAALNAEGVSYVTKEALQKKYPTSSCGFEGSYSSIELKNLFFYKPRTLDKDSKTIRISHVSHPINSNDKGHLTVLEIVKKLNDNGFNTTAKFAGDGKRVEMFKIRVAEFRMKDKIQFLGLLNQDNLRNFLLESNIMVFPSASEGLPRVLIEAMATGLPCVSTNVGGISELLDDSLLFDKDDIEGFTQKIIEIFSNQELYERLSKTNFEKSKEYSREVLEPKRNDFYKKLLDKIRTKQT